MRERGDDQNDQNDDEDDDDDDDDAREGLLANENEREIRLVLDAISSTTTKASATKIWRGFYRPR